VVVISKAVLNKFGETHADVASALNDWYATVKNADWGSFADVKQTYGSVDYVTDNRYVFNIKGNRYRLVAMIFFSVRTVYIKFVGTHADYDKIDVATVDFKD